MDATALLQTMRDWGYYLLPKPHPDSPGYGGVLIAMRQAPTEQHFDPDVLEVRLVDQSEARWSTLTFYSSLNGAHEVLPGRVIIIDRFDKHIEFFTFGATVEELRGLHDVVYAFISAAPVLMMTGDNDNVGDNIAYEAEGLLARRQAMQVRHLGPVLPAAVHSDFAVGLYQMSLEETIHRYEWITRLKMANRGVYAALLREREWMLENGRWQTVNPLPELSFSRN